MKGNNSPHRAGLILVSALLIMSFFISVGCQKQDGTQVPPQLQAVDFAATLTGGDAPLTVQFTDQTTGDINGWWWFFGDGQTSREENPSHTYTTNGTYTVSLTAFVSGEPQTMTKDDYIRVGSQAPAWRLTVVESSVYNIELPPKSVIEQNQQFVVLDLAGEGVIYWTGFAVKDKEEVEWAVTEQYEHSIYIDGIECYGQIDQVTEIWGFQQKKVRRPDAYYPTIFFKGEYTTAQAFWRVNIPFHHSLVFTLENHDGWGTSWVDKAYIAYGLVTSGVPGKGNIPRLGQMWSIKKVNEELGFPAAPKIKAVLEEHFGAKVFSVAIMYGHSEENPEYKWLFVDAPDIERDEIRDFLVGEELIELTYELK